jgi:FkbM family methyltransferase
MQQRQTTSPGLGRRGELLAELNRHYPGFAPSVVFDVGANEGTTSLALESAFPMATIFAFEPVAATFAALTARVRGHERIRPFQLALGRRSGRARMRIKNLSVSNRIAGWRDALKAQERVAMHAGDRFCAEQSVSEIGFLKIDAEGYDLQVLRGFNGMLKAARIDLVEAEVGMSPDNRLHVSFEAVKSYLERRGYRLFLIYEQTVDTPFSGRAVLRRANVAFASPKLAATGLSRE